MKIKLLTQFEYIFIDYFLKGKVTRLCSKVQRELSRSVADAFSEILNTFELFILLLKNNTPLVAFIHLFYSLACKDNVHLDN